MENINIGNFLLVNGLDNVTFLLASGEGQGQRTTPAIVMAHLTASIRPSIDGEGIWHIGSEKTGVLAKAQTPVLRLRDSILEWKYTLEGDDSYRVLMSVGAELQKFFSTLTDEERQRSYVLRIENMTPDEIAILQKPATDKAAEIQTAEDARVSSEANRVKAELARVAAEQERVRAEALRQTNTSKAITDAEGATSYANEVALHPTYIGTDLYVYEYDLATHRYNKTQKLIKAPSFNIDYNYASMIELENHQPTGLIDGLFAIINTQNTEDEDNAKLFISKSGRWQYVVDMSGFRGFRGYTPQLFRGDIIVGNSRTDASVSITEIGRDENNNPKYQVNFRIPSFAFSDFTPDQIAILQKPATDKVAEVQQTVADAQKVVEDTKAMLVQATASNNEAKNAAKAANDAAADTRKAISDANDAIARNDTATQQNVKKVNDALSLLEERGTVFVAISALDLADKIDKGECEMSYLYAVPSLDNQHIEAIYLGPLALRNHELAKVGHSRVNSSVLV